LSKQAPNPFYGINSIYPSKIAVSDLLRPYPEFGDIAETQPIGYSWYHALQVRMEKRMSHGYTTGFSYTWSKAMDATGFLNAGDARVNRTISQYDRPHRLSLLAIYELPLKGRTIGGWQLKSIFTYQSGSALGFGDAIFLGNIRDIALASDQRSVNRWFNTAAGFVTASAQQRASDIRTFPKYLAGVRGDGQTIWNLSLAKNFRIKERLKLEFRAECYDALNHPNFSDPNTTVTSPAFGTVTSQAGLSREFQAALKLVF
jgi:hypothetical protein